MDQAALAQLVANGRLERVSPDSAEATSRLRQARLDLRTAEAVLDEPLFSNAKAACSLTWDAAVGVLTGWLALFGYRITSERGHLTAAIHGVGAILSEHTEGATVVRKLDGLRRLRDNANYNNLPVDPAEVREYLPLVAQLGNWLERAAGNGQ